MELASTNLHTNFALKIISWALVGWTILSKGFSNFYHFYLGPEQNFLLKWYMKYFNIIHIPRIIKFMVITKLGI